MCASKIRYKLWIKFTASGEKVLSLAGTLNLHGMRWNHKIKGLNDLHTLTKENMKHNTHKQFAYAIYLSSFVFVIFIFKYLCLLHLLRLKFRISIEGKTKICDYKKC